MQLNGFKPSYRRDDRLRHGQGESRSSLTPATAVAPKYPRSYCNAANKFEGIGEDFLPITVDLSVIDEVVQIGDIDLFS